MGYCSKVEIYITETKENGIILEDIIYKANLAEKFEEHFYKIGTNDNGNRVLHFQHNSLKWYNRFSFVKFWNLILKQLDEDDYLFIRAGENYEDFETEGSYGYVHPFLDYDKEVDFKEIKNE